jgi:hypothetical protein
MLQKEIWTRHLVVYFRKCDFLFRQPVCRNYKGYEITSSFSGSSAISSWILEEIRLEARFRNLFQSVPFSAGAEIFLALI